MQLSQVQQLLSSRQHWLVITGAGISTESGIPTYRNDNGDWVRSDPITHQQFLESEDKRKRYWARSAVGWPMIAKARPSKTHKALVEIENKGFLSGLITQNVDRLHQKAGHNKVIDLHGRMDRVKCLSCGNAEERSDLQLRIIDKNRFLESITGEVAPDGDASIEEEITERIDIVACKNCNGVLMPDVVFYGGSVPKQTNEATAKLYSRSKGLLVLGSSLMVYSSYRFCKLAKQDSKPIVLINKGKTRADELADIKLVEDCSIIEEVFNV
ncbi:MAG: NAD-dependent protein deacetylase [Kangiellaceae bacterium]|nr:NAD-dependent protein deacetylase [Kangiellaceae bacterium]MCW9018561.1 NAD-dependent protein deacetylase [Kangiellaceae bacterium]